jgi:hypothetical protein
MRKWWITCGLGLCALTLALAQEPLPEPATYKPTSDGDAIQTERAWIQSNDPRLIAWGAYLASKDKRRELIPDVLGRIDLTGVAYPRGDVSDWLYDALIRLDAPMTVARAMDVNQMPQRLILLARAPDNSGTLQEMLSGFIGGGVEWRVVAELLAQHPPSGFAVEILHYLDPTLNIRVVDDKTTPRKQPRGGGMCGDRGAAQVTGVWPPYVAYWLTLRGGTRLLPGTQAGYYSTWAPGIPVPSYGSCILYGEEWVAYRSVAAQLAQIPVVDFPLQHDTSITLDYGKSSWRSEMQAALQKADDDFGRIIATYLRLGLVTQVEADALKMRVLLLDERGIQPAEQLPQPAGFRWLQVVR